MALKRCLFEYTESEKWKKDMLRKIKMNENHRIVKFLLNRMGFYSSNFFLSIQFMYV